MKIQPSITQLSATGAFSDPVRRTLYEYVLNATNPVSRVEAAEAAGISRSLAAYHLDHLVDAGLLRFTYARPEGRTGPGAGRPAKMYERAADEVSINIPPRSYHMLASMLAQAVATDTSGQIMATLNQLAEAEGRRASQEFPELFDGLVELGYKPSIDENGDIIMSNCPFHQIAQQEPELVCALNHQLINGYLEGKHERADRAVLSPCAGRCCVVIRAKGHLAK